MTQARNLGFFSDGLSSVGVASVSVGGTGAAALTANYVLLGNGTSALQVVAPGTSGNVLTSNGTTWQSSTPGGSGAQPFVTMFNGNNTPPANNSDGFGII